MQHTLRGCMQDRTTGVYAGQLHAWRAAGCAQSRGGFGRGSSRPLGVEMLCLVLVSELPEDVQCCVDGCSGIVLTMRSLSQNLGHS
jgi:hypothetical protein